MYDVRLRLLLWLINLRSVLRCLCRRCAAPHGLDAEAYDSYEPLQCVQYSQSVTPMLVGLIAAHKYRTFRNELN